MFKEIKKQYLLSVEDLDKTKQEKKAVKAMLEEKRKKDEEEQSRVFLVKQQLAEVNIRFL